MPHRAGDGAGGDFGARGDKAGAGALECHGVAGELQPERRGLGVDAVRAADGRRHLVLEGAPLQRLQEPVDVGDQEIGGAGELHRQAGVEHVRRGHALMNEARLRPDDFGEVGEEGDDVVLGLALDRIDALDVEDGVPGLGPDRLRGLGRNDAKLGLRIGGVGLDFEPDAEAGLRLPDGGHLRPGIARDHRRLASGKGARP